MYDIAMGVHLLWGVVVLFPETSSEVKRVFLP
jgi:hypothetical protein